MIVQEKQQTTDEKARAIYARAKAAAEKAECQSYWKYTNALIDPPPSKDKEESSSSQKHFWKYIKALWKDNTGVSPIQDHGKLYSSAKEKANILNLYKSIFMGEDQTNIPSPKGIPSLTMPDIVVSEERVLKLLQRINSNKASRPDGIQARILRECAVEIAPLLTTFLTSTLRECIC